MMTTQQALIGEALANYAESWVGVKETKQNRGPEVDHFVRIAGGRAKTAPPWCAYFVSYCVNAIQRVGLNVTAGTDWELRTGRAVNWWLKMSEDRRILPADIWEYGHPRGLIYVRTRSSKPISDAMKVRNGTSRQGHVGICIGLEGTNALLGVAGNSSGSGHSAGSGAVCFERLEVGGRHWDRLVGLARIF